jgi:hypothetical protein
MTPSNLTGAGFFRYKQRFWSGSPLGLVVNGIGKRITHPPRAIAAFPPDPIGGDRSDRRAGWAALTRRSDPPFGGGLVEHPRRAGRFGAGCDLRTQPARGMFRCNTTV